jgi:poly(A) polymerase
MEPLIVDRSQHRVSRQNISPNALRVLNHLHQSGFLAYLAGGGVRDLLLGRRPKDFDVATDAHPQQLRRLFRNCRLIGRRFRLAHILFRDETIEVSTFRQSAAEEAPNDGALLQRHDGLVVRDNLFGTPPDDARRRDFTINALFYNIADFAILDYVGGLKDLDARLVRAIGDPRVRFTEDPVRMLRAVRFAAVLEFRIEEEADRAIGELHERLALAAPSRLFEELLKLLDCGNAEAAFAGLLRTGLFAVLFPAAGAWLRTEEGAGAQPWMNKALRQMDIWRKAGATASVPLLLALLFGPYHEARAAALGREGRRPAAALSLATHDHLSGLNNRVRIPKHMIRDAASIMSVQTVFRSLRGKHPNRFLARPGFHDALVYLKFAARQRGQDADLVTWWEQFLPGRRRDAVVTSS